MKVYLMPDFDNPFWREDVPNDDNYDPDDQKGGKDYENDLKITEPDLD